jgi:hypothetical protein
MQVLQLGRVKDTTYKGSCRRAADRMTSHEYAISGNLCYPDLLLVLLRVLRFIVFL